MLNADFLPLIVAARILANPASNVLQKRLAAASVDPLFVIGATHALLAIPCHLVVPWTVAAGASFWANIGVAAALAVAGNVLLVHALRSGDLSVLGPINAYKALVSLVLGIFLLGEVPTLTAFAGMLLILSGSVFVFRDGTDVDGVDRLGGRRMPAWSRDPGIRFRFGALALSATEAVFLKRALLLSSPLTAFVLWSILGVPIAAVAIAGLLRHRVRNQAGLLRSQWRLYVALAATTGIMQLTTLFTFGRLQVGPSLALFQLSALVSVFLGYRYFEERHVRRRLFGAGVMVAGAGMIAGAKR
jgi:drug/metabolite transporter (DMT)-like permease